MLRYRGFITLAALLSISGGPLIILVSIITTNAFTNIPIDLEVLGLSTTLSPLSENQQMPTPTPSIALLQQETPTATPSPTHKPSPAPTIKPSPTPTPYQVTATQLDGWFAQYAGVYGIDRELIKRIARCESTFKPSAKNGPYLGLYQFDTRTWIKTRQGMNLDTNPNLRHNPEESIKTASFLISTRGTSPWPNCGK